MATEYFTPDLFGFLKDLRAHNNRDWFLNNKERYERSVRAPFLRLIGDLGPRLKKISPHFIADPRPVGGSMSHINRDTRFSKDKSPYKTAMFAHFHHEDGTEEATPAFYMHVEPGASTVGGGVWHPAAAPLKQIRDAIAKAPADWKRARSAGVGPACSMAGGESLKRVPPGYDADHPFADDLRRKDFGLHMDLSDAQMVSAKLPAYIEEAFKASAPLLRFLCKATGFSY